MLAHTVPLAAGDAGRSRKGVDSVRRAAVNVSLALASVMTTLLFLEIGVRIVMSFDRNYLDEIVNFRPAQGGEELSLADIILPVEDDLLVYVLRPGVQGLFMGRKLSINSLGMRDRERRSEKAPGVFRILGLGDSHTFGWGVGREETYLARIEEMLNERAEGQKFEVLNMGVPGYNTVQEVQAFSRRAGELSPDMVIINYVHNDMDLPNFLTRRPDLWTLRKTYLGGLVRRRLAIARGSHLLPASLSPVPPDEETMHYRMPEERIPERFRPLYGRENMVAGYLRLARLARERGIPYVLLFNMDDYRHRLLGRTPTVLPYETRELAALCKEEGYVVVDPQERVFRYLTENSHGTEALWISETDSHTNSIRHQFVADELLNRLETAGLLPPVE
jgi:lysophospholipase L1-like esterase